MKNKKIFRTTCLLTQGKYITGIMLPGSISVDTADNDTSIVTFTCLAKDKVYCCMAKLDTFNRLISKYIRLGTTIMETDTEFHANVRYTKGGMGVKDKHVTMSLSDDKDSDFMITAEATEFDKWLRAMMRKEENTI